jgi:3-phenylpropionate/trans-cinnamate dioxygenase ferredoxin subunit
MIQWFNVATTQAFPIGTHKVLEVEGIALIVFNLEGEYYALHNQCTHANYPLDEGPILGDEIICPLHGARFCIKTGEARSAPAFVNVDTYPTRIENTMVQVGLRA